MTVVPLKKLTLCGPAHEKAEIISRLQEMGCLHIVPLAETGPPLEPDDAVLRRRAEAAWKHLTAAPRLLRPLPADSSGDDLGKVIGDTLANKERIRVARDNRDRLNARIEGLEDFGDFAMPPEAALRGVKLWFYVLPVKERKALEALEIPWEIVGRDRTRLFVVLLAREEPPADTLPVARTHTGARALSALRSELETTEIEIERAEDAWAELSRHRLVLGLRLAREADSDDRSAVALTTRDEGAIFALQAWVPAENTPDLTGLAEEMRLAVTLDDPGPDDHPPTRLDNPGRFSGAGGLTEFYLTPDYRGWDPSLIVFFSFAVFFAMIIADAGYAAVLSLGLAFYWNRLGASETGVRTRNMLAVVFGTALIYGVLAGSYFGIDPPEDSFFGRIAFIDVANFDVMMKVSLIIGVLHISLANLQVVLRNRGTGLAITRLGWIAVSFGGLLAMLFPSKVWYLLIIAGLAAVFIGSGLDKPINEPKDWLGRITAGALGLTGLTKIFGDILSYMRLFALGLASASLAATFNQLAESLSGGKPGLGFLLGLLVLVFGHGINLAMGILSGVVHGLRLNYIEFFNWGLSDEGYPFKVFARRETTG